MKKIHIVIFIFFCSIVELYAQQGDMDLGLALSGVLLQDKGENVYFIMGDEEAGYVKQIEELMGHFGKTYPIGELNVLWVGRLKIDLHSGKIKEILELEENEASLLQEHFSRVLMSFPNAGSGHEKFRNFLESDQDPSFKKSFLDPKVIFTSQGLIDEIHTALGPSTMDQVDINDISHKITAWIHEIISCTKNKAAIYDESEAYIIKDAASKIFTNYQLMIRSIPELDTKEWKAVSKYYEEMSITGVIPFSRSATNIYLLMQTANEKANSILNRIFPESIKKGTIFIVYSPNIRDYESYILKFVEYSPKEQVVEQNVFRSYVELYLKSYKNMILSFPELNDDAWVKLANMIDELLNGKNTLDLKSFGVEIQKAADRLLNIVIEHNIKLYEYLPLIDQNSVADKVTEDIKVNLSKLKRMAVKDWVLQHPDIYNAKNLICVLNKAQNMNNIPEAFSIVNIVETLTDVLGSTNDALLTRLDEVTEYLYLKPEKELFKRLNTFTMAVDKTAQITKALDILLDEYHGNGNNPNIQNILIGTPDNGHLDSIFVCGADYAENDDNIKTKIDILRLLVLANNKDNAVWTFMRGNSEFCKFLLGDIDMYGYKLDRIDTIDFFKADYSDMIKGKMQDIKGALQLLKDVRAVQK